MGMAVTAPDLEPVPPPSSSPRYRAWLRANFLPYALISPSVLVIAGILAFPLGMLVWLSLQHYGLRELIHHAGEWVGLDNYRAILVDPLFHQVIVRSLLFTFTCVALTVVLSTLIALLLLKVRSAVRILVMSSLVFVWATPVIVSVDIWQWMFDYEFGVINYLLTSCTSATSSTTAGSTTRCRASASSSWWSCGAPSLLSRSPYSPACCRSLAR